MLRACGLLTPEGVGDVFRWAAAADPGAELCLNEWAPLEGTNWQGLAELARALLAAGAPVGCIGVQARVCVCACVCARGLAAARARAARCRALAR